MILEHDSRRLKSVTGTFERVGQPLSEYRRALLGVEGADGRPYIVDIMTVRGGQRHALYNSAWAERGEAKLPSVKKRVGDLSEALRELRRSPEKSLYDKISAYVRNCEVLDKPKDMWSLTWKTDYAAYATRDPKKTPFVRPLPDDVGKVRLRFLGLPLPGQDNTLIRAKGPWVSIINQPTSSGTNLYGNVGFLDATDMLIETHNVDKGKASSRFVHIMEGYREGEESVIKAVEMLPLKSGSASKTLALKVTRTDGLVDIITYQEAPKMIKLANGITTDARYALVRLGTDGNWTEAHMVEGTVLKGLGMNFTGGARFTGVITDLAGDLIGTRHESALIIKPDKPWSTSLVPGCKQLIVEGPNALRAPICEAYSLDKITKMENGSLRLDIAGTPPLANGWHQVSELDPKRPNFFRTTRPMMFGSETQWYAGMEIWFPRLNKTFRFKDLTGGFHMCTEGTLDNADLAAEGVKPGDWFVVHFLKPGLKVSLVNSINWTRSELSQ